MSKKLACRRNDTSGYYSTDDDTVVKEHAKQLCGFDEMHCHCCGISNTRIEGMLLQCAACRVAYYCSVDCFNQHLPHHAPFCRPAQLDQGPKPLKSHGPTSPPVNEPPPCRDTGPVKTRYIDTSCSESETEPESVAPRPRRKSPRRLGQKRPKRAPTSPQRAAPPSPPRSPTSSAAALRALEVARTLRPTASTVPPLVSQNTTPASPPRNSAVPLAVVPASSPRPRTSVSQSPPPRMASESVTTRRSARSRTSLRSAAALQALEVARSVHSPAAVPPAIPLPVPASPTTHVPPVVPTHVVAPRTPTDALTTTRHSTRSRTTRTSARSAAALQALSVARRATPSVASQPPTGPPSLVSPAHCYGYGTADVPSEDEWDEETWDDSFDGEDEGPYEDDYEDDEWEEVTVTTTHDETVTFHLESTTRRSGGGTLPLGERTNIVASGGAPPCGAPAIVATETPSVTPSVSTSVRRSFIESSCSESETETESMAALRVSRRRRRKRSPVAASEPVAHGDPSTTSQTDQVFAIPHDSMTSTSTRNQESSDETDAGSFTSPRTAKRDTQGTVVSQPTSANAPYAQFRLDHPGGSHASLVSGARSVTLASQTDTDTLSDMELLSLEDKVSDPVLASGGATDPGSVAVPEQVDYEIEHSCQYRGGGNLHANGSERQPEMVVLKPTQRNESNMDRATPKWTEHSLRQGSGNTSDICNAIPSAAESSELELSESSVDSDRQRRARQQLPAALTSNDIAATIDDVTIETEESRRLRGGGLLRQSQRSRDQAPKLVTRCESSVDAEVTPTETILRSTNGSNVVEVQNGARLESNQGTKAVDEYETGHELNFTTEDCISDYDDGTSSSSDFDFNERRRNVHESTWYPKQQRRHSIDSAEDIDIIISRLRYGGGYMGPPGHLKQSRRNSASVCLRPTARERRSYPWTRPEWTAHRLRKVDVKRNESIAIAQAGNAAWPHDKAASCSKLSYFGTLNSPVQAHGHAKPTIEWEKPQWIDSRLRSTSPERTLERLGQKAKTKAKHMDGPKPEWIQKKSGLKPTTNGRKLQRMGTFREEFGRERIDKHKETNKSGCIRDSSNPAAVPDIVKRALLPRAPKLK